MADDTEDQSKSGGSKTTTVETSYLDHAVAMFKGPKDEAVRYVDALISEYTRGTPMLDKNLSRTVKGMITRLDQELSKQLAAIMHHEKFKALEGSWRGLHYLVKNSKTGPDLQIKVMNTKKSELAKDLEKAAELPQAGIFQKIYTEQFDTPGGQPFGALVGDYQIDNSDEDLQFLRNMSNVAATAFAPFITSPSAGFFGFDDMRDLATAKDISSLMNGKEYTKWKSFRDTEDSRFVSFAMPRALARLPYSPETKKVEEFTYDERPAGGGALDHENYCWMNAAFVMAQRMTHAYAEYGWCTAIRGAEGGGKVENLPLHVFKSADGDLEEKCPTEVSLPGTKETELSELGFLPLCHYKNTDYAVFFGGQSTQKAKKYDEASATENAAISARLPYIMATSRIAHYLKVMARDWIGRFMEAEDCEKALNRWIMTYVNAKENAGQELRAKYPLREARIVVERIPGKPGSYSAVAHLRPWLQLESLTTSLRLTTEIPAKKG